MRIDSRALDQLPVKYGDLGIKDRGFRAQPSDGLGQISEALRKLLTLAADQLDGAANLVP